MHRAFAFTESMNQRALVSVGVAATQRQRPGSYRLLDHDRGIVRPPQRDLCLYRSLTDLRVNGQGINLLNNGAVLLTGGNRWTYFAINQQDLHLPLLYRREAVENARKIELVPQDCSPLKNLSRKAEQHVAGPRLVMYYGPLGSYEIAQQEWP